MSKVLTTQQAENELRAWKTRADLIAADRDAAVRAASDAGLTDVRIRELTGLSRMTIAQIKDPHGALTLAEKARRALRHRGVTAPRIWATKNGHVYLTLPYDPPELPVPDMDTDTDWFEQEYVHPAHNTHRRNQEIERLNWAGAVIDFLRSAGIAVTASDEPHGDTVREHLAHPSEQYAVLTFKEQS